jgi:hypothetical protein
LAFTYYNYYTILGDKNPVEIWQNKIHHLRKFHKGWAYNQSSTYKKEKQCLQDIKAESSPLTVSEREIMREANDKVA